MKQKRLAGDYSNTKIISFLESGGIPKILDKNKHVLVYLWTILGCFPKLGEVSGAHGVSPQEAFEGRYKDGSVRLTKLTVLALFILPKNPKKERGYDKELHRLINVHSSKLGFFCPGVSSEVNQEQLENFRMADHFSRLVEVIENYTERSHSFKKEFNFRTKTQKEEVQDWCRELEKSGRCLANSHTAFGKSTCVPYVVCKVCSVGDIALSTTPIVETLDDMVEKLTTFIYAKPIKVFTNKDLIGKSKNCILLEITLYRKTHIVFLCFSVQDIRHKDEGGTEGELRVKFSFLEGLDIKLYVRDEYHMQYNAEKTSKILANIKAEKILDLTATVYKLLHRYNDYTPDQIRRCDNLWAVYQKHIIKNPDYADFPDLDLCCVSFERTFKHDHPAKTIFSNVAEEYREKKLFECKNGKFVQLDALVDTFRFVCDSEIWAKNAYVSLSEKKNPFCARISTSLSQNTFTFGLVRIPEGTAEFTAGEKCELLKNELNAIIKTTLFKTADDFIRGKRGVGGTTGLLARWQKEAEAQGKTSLVIVTHEQLVVGTDIPPLCFAYLFDRISSPDVLIQFFGRMQRTFEGKTKVRCYVMCPGMYVQLSAEMYQVVKDFSDKPKVQRELYDCMSPLYWLEGDDVAKTISFEQAIKNTNIWLARNLDLVKDITAQYFSKFPGLAEHMAAIDMSDFKNLKDNVGKRKDKFTDDTNGETYVPQDQDDSDEEGGKGTEKQQQTSERPLYTTLSVMLRTAQALDLVDQHNGTLKQLWNTPLAKVWFDEKKLDVVKHLLDYPEFFASFNHEFEEKRDVIKSESVSDAVLGERVFLNEKFLVKPGMAYVPKTLGEELVTRVDCTVSPKIIGVFNALNGMLPALLQKRYPTAKIICIEHFDYFRKHLTNMGFTVHLHDSNTWQHMHFDCSILNPPYNGNLDLQFIKSACGMSDRVVCVHPAISTISRKDTKRFVEHKKFLDGHVSYIKLFNGNPVFGIGLFYPCEIIDIDMTKTFKKIDVEYSYDNKTVEKHEFKSLFDVTKWGNVSEYYSLEKKVLAYCEKNDHCEKHRDVKSGEWFVNMSQVRGHPHNDTMTADDFYTTVVRDYKPEKSQTNHTFFTLKTKNEAEIFVDFLQGNFARFSLALLKNNQQLCRGEFKSVPYLPHYDTPWTKAKLTKLFSITDKEWAFIEKVIPKYYD